MIRVLGDFMRRLRAIFWRTHLNRELEDELQMHLEMEARKYVQSGVPEDEARRRARLAFGGLSQTAEDCREARGLSFAENALRDVVYALRSFRRSPGFAFTVIVTIALALGANLTILNFCRTILIESLPVPHPGELFLASVRTSAYPENQHFSYSELQQMQNVCTSAHLAGFTDQFDIHVREDEGTTSTLTGQLITGNFFSALQISPRLGRVPNDEDNRIGTAYVAAISYRLWSTKYNQDEGIIGRQLLIQKVPITVIGVMPRGFDGIEPGRRTDIWMPLSAQAGIGFSGYASMNNVDIHKPWMNQDVSWLHLLARSPSDAGGRHLEAGLNHYLQNEISTELKNVHDEGTREALVMARFHVREAGQGMPGLKDLLSLPLKILLGIAAVLLLSGCLNITGLFLARSRVRQHEAQIRLSLGSGRLRIMAERATEILLLSTIGGAFSLLLARWASALIVHWLYVNQSIEINADLNGQIVVIAVALTFVIGLLVTVIPALHLRDLSLLGRVTTRTVGTSSRSSRISSWLVAAQLSFAVVSLTVTSLLVRTLLNYEHLNLGVDLSHTLSVSLDPAAAGYNTAGSLNALYRQLTERIDQIPGVVSSSVAGCGLMNGGCAYVGAKVSGGEEKQPMVERNFVGPNYFSTTGMQLLRGRGITQEDKAESELVAVVNQSFEKDLLRGANALGHFITAEGKRLVIVGVVADSRTNGIKDRPSPFMFLPIAQAGGWDISHLEIRTSGDPHGVVSAVRKTILTINRAIPIAEIVSLREEADRGLAREILLGRLAMAFSILSVLISAVGLYGVINYEVAHRRAEFAVRMAVGARREAILQYVLSRSSLLWAAGCAVGVGASWCLRQTISSLLFQVSSYDLRADLISIFTLLVISGAAVFLPAWRAASTDPASVLRND